LKKTKNAVNFQLVSFFHKYFTEKITFHFFSRNLQFYMKKPTIIEVWSKTYRTFQKKLNLKIFIGQKHAAFLRKS
jgi:hypothetical protein